MLRKWPDQSGDDLSFKPAHQEFSAARPASYAPVNPAEIRLTHLSKVINDQIS
jgi:hypothetical protein